MARKFSITGSRMLSDINMTPLMDLTFVLLITFIITFPLIEQGIPIQLPEASAESLTSEDNARTVSLNRDSELFLDDARLSHDELRVELNRLRDLDDQVTIMVRADQELPYREIVRVLKILHGARITRMALVTVAEDDAA